MREERMELRPAVLESLRTRIRPIFMTTTTTVLGLAPLVIFPGAGSELYRGLGSVVLGGLAVSTIVTLVLVPHAVHVDCRSESLGRAAGGGLVARNRRRRFRRDGASEDFACRSDRYRGDGSSREGSREADEREFVAAESTAGN